MTSSQSRNEARLVRVTTLRSGSTHDGSSSMNQRRVAALLCMCALASCSRSIPMDPDPPMPTVEDRDPSFSPDGDSIAFVHWASDWRDTLRPTGLYVVGAAGGEPRLVLSGAIISPDWSPDGRWIAFTLAYGSPLFVVSPDGSGLRQMT